MNWQGINRRVEPNDLPDGQSPDTTNCRPYQNQIGLLGPRPGKSYTSNTALDYAVKGISLYTLPNRNRRWLISDTNGAVTDSAAQLTSASNPTYAGMGSSTSGILTMAAVDLTLTYPSTTTNTYNLFGSSANRNPTDCVLIESPLLVDFTVTGTGLAGFTGPGLPAITFLPCDASGAAIGNSALFQLDFSAGTALDAGTSTMTATYEADSTLIPWMGVTWASAGAIYGLRVTIAATWNGSVTAGSVRVRGCTKMAFISL